MKNKARLPYFLRRQAYRWTRPPQVVKIPEKSETCTDAEHVWVFRDDTQEARCICGRFVLNRQELDL